MTRARDFWTDRRARVAAETKAEKNAIAEAQGAEEQLALEGRTDAEILDELDLPEPELMKEGDDFSAFMQKAVPERIRRRALRTLWKSNPILANVDSLVDYGEDFTDSANVVANLQTTYTVGKGMLAHLQEMARQAEEEATTKAEMSFETANDNGIAEENANIDESAAFAEDVEVAESVQPAEVKEETGLVGPARRMQFRFEGSA